MKNLEFVFEEYAWQRILDAKKQGDNISAAQLLALLEDADETQVTQALECLQEKRITLDISDLPKFSTPGATAKRLSLEEKLVKQNLLPQGLEENDPLRLYLEELSQMNKAEDAVSRLLPQAVAYAKEYVGKGVLLLDLIQEASLGLLQGAENDREDLQSTFVWWVRQSLAQAVFLQAKASGVGQKMRQALEDYRMVDERLLTELGRNPTIEEIAEGMHMSLQEAGAVAETFENVMRMHRVKTPEHKQLPEEEDQAVEDTAYFQMRQRISELLSTLSEEDAKLLTLRYGLEGGLPMKPIQVAAQLGLTEQDVILREAAALNKLRQE